MWFSRLKVLSSASRCPSFKKLIARSKSQSFLLTFPSWWFRRKPFPAVRWLIILFSNSLRFSFFFFGGGGGGSSFFAMWFCDCFVSHDRFWSGSDVWRHNREFLVWNLSVWLPPLCFVALCSLPSGSPSWFTCNS